MEFTNRFRDIVLTPDAVGKIDELLTKFPIGVKLAGSQGKEFKEDDTNQPKTLSISS